MCPPPHGSKPPLFLKCFTLIEFVTYICIEHGSSIRFDWRNSFQKHTLGKDGLKHKSKEIPAQKQSNHWIALLREPKVIANRVCHLVPRWINWMWDSARTGG